ncbi:MAG: rhomboid family intramembrane serine protease [Limisphaerales bacterium]
MKNYWQALPPGTRFLATLHALGFLGILLLRVAAGVDLTGWIALDGSALNGFQVWRLLTYHLVGGDPLNAFFGTLFILFVGPGVERAWTPTRMIGHYIACGIASGVVLAWILRNYQVGILTNSGAILGLVVPWFLINRFQRFQLFANGPDISAAAGAMLWAACVVAPFGLSCGWRLTPGIIAGAPVGWALIRVHDLLADRRVRAAGSAPRGSRLEL